MIEAFFFNNEQLFGCYHPAKVFDSKRFVLICPPFFDEYRRSYRALAELSIAIAEQGAHVLRFDYFGTGESQGLLEHATVEQWKLDVEAAIEEGLSLSGADELVLVGVRFGATLASQSKHDSITRYIFWDPIVSGSAYLDWIDEVNRQIRQEHKLLSRYTNAPFEKIEYENFYLPPELREGIAKIRLDQKKENQAAKSFIITTDQSVFDSNIFANCEFTGLSYDWPAYHNGVILPKPVLEAIARRALTT